MMVHFLDDRRAVMAYCKKHHIKFLGLFGSRARQEENKESDVDLLVEFSAPVSLIDFVRLERELSQMIGISVDLVSKKGLSPFVKPYIENDLKVLYEER